MTEEAVDAAPEAQALLAGDTALVGEHERLHWLMRAVASEGALTLRAEEIDAARRAVLDLNNLAGESLVDWLEGDIGCGLRLTPRGRRVSVALLVMRQNARQLGARFGGGFVEDLRMLERVNVRTSARNQLFARVECIGSVALQQQVALRLADGQRLTALVTRASVESLGLQPGSDVIALFKAPSVRAVPMSQSLPATGEPMNRLEGWVRSVECEQGRAEVLVQLAPGLSAVSLMPEAQLCGIASGDVVALLFPASSVILGIMA